MPRGYTGSTIDVSIRDSWRTPDFAFTPLDAEFDFGLDAAASVENAKVPQFLTIKDDALSCCWASRLLPFAGRTVWINPPYSNIPPWLEKAKLEAVKNHIISVLLIPHSPDAAWWPNDASEIRVVTGAIDENGKKHSGRIQFIRADTGKPHGNQSKGSCYVIFAPGSLGNMVTKYVKITDLKKQHEQILEERKLAEVKCA